MARKDLTGQRFGRLTVIRATEQRTSFGCVIYECLCDCGNVCLVWGNRLTTKTHSRKRSCGCLYEETHEPHGGSSTNLYMRWSKMKDRCSNPNAQNYKRYGGRGIRVCDDWQNSFATFRDWALSNGYKEELTLDRIDVNGNYCPENCRWITNGEQQRNRRNNLIVEMGGQKMSLSDWCEKLGIPYVIAYSRIHTYHWSPERALTEPVKKK